MNPPLREAVGPRRRSSPASWTARSTRSRPTTRRTTPTRRPSISTRRPSAIVGLETAVSVVHDRLVARGRFGLDRFVALFSAGPARAFGLPGGHARSRLARGRDPLRSRDARWKVDPHQFVSKGRSTPFAGWELAGRPGRDDRRRRGGVAAGRALALRSAAVRLLSRFLPLALLLLASTAAAAPTRRVAIRVSADLPRSGVEGLAEAARARGVEVDLAAEGAAVPAGFDLLRLSTLPPPDAVRDAVLVFPIGFEAGAFVFDGRTYRQKNEAVRLTASTGGEIFVLGDSAAAVLALAGRWLAGAPPASDYEVLSGELTRSGRFERRDGRLVVDRASDRDRIAQREAFLACPEASRRAARSSGSIPRGPRMPRRGWEKTASRFVRKGKLVVRVYPDTVTKAALTGSARAGRPLGRGRRAARRPRRGGAGRARPGDAGARGGGARRGGPDAVRRRPALLAAAGAQRAGRWWGRDVTTFAAFTHAAGVDPSIEDVLASADSLSPVLDGRDRRVVARRRGAPRERGGRREVPRQARRGPRAAARAVARPGRWRQTVAAAETPAAPGAVPARRLLRDAEHARGLATSPAARARRSRA